MREYIICNFSIIFKSNPTIPISILLDPFLKRLQVSELRLDIFDYDFLSIIAQYPRLSIKYAIQLIDIVGKLYLNDIFYSKASSVPFTHLASRFLLQATMQEYLFMFTKYSLNQIILIDQLNLKQLYNKDKDDILEKLQQRNRILDMIN